MNNEQLTLQRKTEEKDETIWMPNAQNEVEIKKEG